MTTAGPTKVVIDLDEELEEEGQDAEEDYGRPDAHSIKMFDSYFLYSMDKLDHESTLKTTKVSTRISTIKHHDVKSIRSLALFRRCVICTLHIEQQSGIVRMASRKGGHRRLGQTET